MPLYMDVHNIAGGVSCDDVAQAHQADLQTQGDVHRKAHGLVAGSIHQVQEGS